jgi:hypothetical protein
MSPLTTESQVSETLENFLDGLREVGDLLSLHSGVPGAVQDDALCRSSVILMVSHFESFLQSLAADFVESIDRANIVASRIPVRLRELHTIPQLETIVKCNDETQRRSLLKKLGNHAAIWNDDAKLPPGTLISSKLSRLVTNAKSECIDDLFSHMGDLNGAAVGDLDYLLSDGEEASINIGNFLRTLVGARDNFAHGKRSDVPTKKDLEGYLLVLTALAKRYERKSSRLLDQAIEG